MFEKHRLVLELALEKKLPEQVNEDSGIDLDVFQELLEAKYITAIEASTLHGPNFLQPRITITGREYLERLRTNMRGQTVLPSSIDLFISHSSQDVDFVKLLITLFQSALQLSSRQIRCTSVDGFRLPAGVDANQQLRREVLEARAFIGVISMHSTRSLYVAFELGARWGAEKSLFPLLAPRADMSLLGGPLAGLNALRADNRSQLHQLVGDLAGVLGVTADQPQAYEAHIDPILTYVSGPPLVEKAAEVQSEERMPSDEEASVLRLFATLGDNLDEVRIAADLKEHPMRIKHHLDRLDDGGWLSIYRYHRQPRPTYRLTQKGRAYLVEKGFV